MNLRDLQYLIAIEETRHFHRAAARCFVSQPTLSGQIKKLEQTLGVVLIERTSRQVTMTEVGMAVVSRAREIMAGVNEIKELSQAYQDPMAGNMRLGIIPTLAPYLLPIIMPHLNSHYPELKLWLYEYQTQQCLEKLANAELDVLLLALPIAQHDFVEVDIFREPFRLACKNDKQARGLKDLTMADIDMKQMLLLEEGHCLREHVLDACVLADVKDSAAYQATSLETLRHMVAEGMGITLIPELAVPTKQYKNDALRYIEFSDPKPNRRIGMLYRQNSYRAPAFEAIGELIKTVLPVSIFF